MVIGTVFTGVLGLGVLFLSIYTTSGSASNGAANVNVLFGSIFGLGAGRPIWPRPSVSCSAPGCSASRGRCCSRVSTKRSRLPRGVPVRALGVGFLVLVGVCAGEATQAVGALLLVGLIAGPAGAAQRLTDRPWIGLGAAAGIAVGSMWIGLIVSYLDGSLPPSFSIMAVVAGCYVLAVAVPTVAGRVRR